MPHVDERPPDEGDDFDRFLKAASRRVEGWPEWKKKLFGWNYDSPVPPPAVDAPTPCPDGKTPEDSR